jgi:hypothetical protein
VKVLSALGLPAPWKVDRTQVRLASVCPNAAGVPTFCAASAEHNTALIANITRSGIGVLFKIPKKRLELVALKAAIGQIGQDYAFSERRAAC